MYNILPVYINDELIQPLLENNQRNWLLTLDSENQNLIRAFVSDWKEYNGSAPTVTTSELRKVNVSDLGNKALSYDSIVSLLVGEFLVETKAVNSMLLYRIRLDSDYLVTDATEGLSQLYITMSNSDNVYSDVLCISGAIQNARTWETGGVRTWKAGSIRTYK